MNDDLSKHVSVHNCVGMEVKHIVRECLVPFPYIWASVDNFDLCLLYMLDVAQLLVCEYKLLFMPFRSTDPMMPAQCSPVCEWLLCSECFKPSNETSPLLFRE